MDDLALARGASAVAAGIIRDWGTRAKATRFKGEVDPVTAADRAAEEAIVAMISRHRPDDSILAEEGGGNGGGGRRWVVDPLDGTVNFLHGIPHVAVSIALEDESGTLLGVVRDVFRDEEFLAERGGGATRDGEPIRVSGCTELDRALVSTGFPYDRHERPGEYARHVESVLRRTQGLRRAGAAALDLAWVAAGLIDAHWEFRLSPWDVAAGFLLVTEAGGSVIGFGSEPSHLAFVAGSPAIAPLLRDLISESR